MREIKFRGWHTTQKVMYSPETMASDQLTLLTTGSFINVSGIDTRRSTIYPQGKFIPLQYTGLKDKNGVEIYEGDIINIYILRSSPTQYGSEEICVTATIEYSNGSFWFIGKNYNITDCNWHHYDQGEREVIGNIYVNPELLENKDE